MPNDYRLTFADRDEWLAVADAHGWVQRETVPAENPDDPPIVVSETIFYPGMDVVDIGTIYDQPDPEQPPVPLPGYAVNLRFNGWCNTQELPSDMAQFVTMPADPRYTFAGGWFQGPIPQGD